MALAIDASSPAIATQTNGATATVTTASFTPPSGSILLVAWAGNSASGADPASTPTVTDNRGVPLTYGQAAWSHRGDTPNADGQAAIWTAHVTSSAAMTVTVTNIASSGNRHAALKVYVITGADTSNIDGATGKSGSTSTGSIAQVYSAQQTNAQGFIAVCDWDVMGTMTAGTGCTRDGSAAVGTAITYGFLRRTSADDVSGNNNTLNVTLGGTSGNVRWAYVEIRVASGTDATATPAVLATTTALPRPDVNVVAGPAVLATAGALARPNVNVVAAPAVLPTVAALPQPAVNVTVGATVLATVTALPQATPSVGGDGTATPAVVATVTALPRPDVNISAGPAVVPVTVTLPAVGVNVVAGPAVVPCTVALVRPDVNISAGPPTVATTTTLPSVAVNVTVGATVIPTVVTIPTPGAGGSTVATPAVITVTLDIPRPAVNISAGPATIATVVTIPQVTLPGSTANATSDPTVAAAVASVAAVSALRSSAPTVAARATSASTVSDG